jgi:hypothetical protein
MDMKNKASYLKYASADWNMGFVVLNFGKKGMSVEVVPVNHDGSFSYNKRSYGS